MKYLMNVIATIMIVSGISMTLFTIITETYIWLIFWLVVISFGIILIMAEKERKERINYLNNIISEFLKGKDILIETAPNKFKIINKDKGYVLSKDKTLISNQNNSFSLSHDNTRLA